MGETAVVQQGLRDALVAVVGDRHVLTGRDLTASYETDWTGTFTGRSAAVVRPAGPEELGGVLRACSAARQPLVLQGGNTGLVGGATPRDGDVVVSLGRCTELGALDSLAGEITVGAGTTLARVQRALRGTGWDVGTDLASRDSASIGGMVATNAGGSRVVAYGSVREQVAGLRWVLADGTVVDRLERPAQGQHRLRPRRAARRQRGHPGRRSPRSGCGWSGRRATWPSRSSAAPRWPRGSASSAGSARAGRGPRSSCWRTGSTWCARISGCARRCRSGPAVVLVLEVGADRDAMAELGRAVGDADGVAVAATSADRARLWRFRESHTEALAAQGPVVKLDVAVPPGRLDEHVAAIRAAAHAVAPGGATYVFGHLAEANLHVNVVGAADRREEVTDAVLRCVAAVGGSISAEHGIGRAKARWLPLARSSAEIALLREVKRAWDPGLLLGPGVLVAEPG